jgi:hypothetical protein
MHLCLYWLKDTVYPCIWNRAQQANIMSQQSSPTNSALGRDTQTTPTAEDNARDIFEDVFGEFEWDSCNIVRILDADVIDPYPNAMINLQWENLSDPIRAALPCLHTLDLHALQCIDVVALEAFIVCVSKAIIKCAPLQNRYKLINLELCDNLKKNIERFHAKDNGEPTEAERICESYTSQLGEKHRKEYTAEEKAQIQIADELMEERIRTNSAARRRQQHAKKLLVKQTTQRGVVKGIMREAVKEKVTSVDESTMYHLSRSVTTSTANIILDKFAPKKEDAAAVINPKYELLGSSSSIRISEVVKQLNASQGSNKEFGSVVRGKKGFEFNFAPARQSSGSSIFGISAEQSQGSNRWGIAALQAMNNGRGNKYDHDSTKERRDTREYNEYNNVPETKWSRGSTNDAEPVHATSTQGSGWSRGSSNTNESRGSTEKPKQRSFADSARTPSPAQGSGWSRGSANDMEPEILLPSRKQTGGSFERGSAVDRDHVSVSSEKKNEKRAAWPPQKVLPRTIQSQVRAGNPNRWNLLDTAVEDVSANNTSGDDDDEH